MRDKKKLIYFGIFLGISILMLSLIFVLFVLMPESFEEVSSFEECASKGYPILKSNPSVCVTPLGTSFFEEISSEKVCTSNGGKWISEFSECEGISKEYCENSGGVFNECASACRNNPEADFCIMMCVAVCKY